MRSFEFCLPSKGISVPAGPDWLHEVKYDGYRLRLERDGDRVRLITRGGYNWADRYPWITEAARKVRQKHFVLDGEAVVLGVDLPQISTRFTRASTMMRFSFAPSIFSPKVATTSACFRCRCERRIWSACWRGVLKACSSIRLSGASLGLNCFALPARSALKD
ncbi:hypothetical protein ACVIWV_002853 [Bradyrhizobium diazoefficiens]